MILQYCCDTYHLLYAGFPYLISIWYRLTIISNYEKLLINQITDQILVSQGHIQIFIYIHVNAINGDIALQWDLC